MKCLLSDCTDIAVSLIVLILFSWLYAVLAILVRVKLGKPVILLRRDLEKLIRIREKKKFSNCINPTQ